MKPVPCRIADPVMAPNMSPPGNRSRRNVNRKHARDHGQQDHFAQHGNARWPARGRHRRHHQPEQRQAVRQSDDQQQNAHGLHDGDGAQIAAELRGQRNHLRQRARTRAHQRRQRIPAVHHAQIERGGEHHAERGENQEPDARRPCGHAAQRFRCDHGAQQNADDDIANADKRERHLDRAAQQSRRRHSQYRAGNQARGKPEQRESQRTGERDRECLGNLDKSAPWREGEQHRPAMNAPSAVRRQMT